MTDTHIAPQSGAEKPQAAAPAYRPDLPAALRAMTRNDVVGFLQSALVIDGAPGVALKQIRDASPVAYEMLGRMAQHLFALRNENVVALGNDEAFAMRSADAEIQRLTARVNLSEAEGDLYFFKGKAKLTLVGLRKLNRVAGLHVGLTPTVCVGGQEMANPYVQRSPSTATHLGDVQRVVVSAVAVGRTLTGSVVAVRYVLEYEPVQELRAMLLKLIKSEPANGCPVKLFPSEFAAEEQGRLGPTWKMFPAFAGMSFLVDLTHNKVLDKLMDYHSMLSHAERRAQSFAMRNAMSAHPALSFGTLLASENRQGGGSVASVTVTGWRGDSSEVMQRLVKSTDMEALERAIEVHTVEGAADLEDIAASPDPDAEDEGDSEQASEVVTTQASAAGRGSSETIRRNELIAQIDEQLAKLSPERVQRAKDATGYSNPSSLSVGQLEQTLAACIKATSRLQQPPVESK